MNEIEERSIHLLQFDGAASPNPGRVGAGAVLFGPNLESKRPVLLEMGDYHPHGTNNFAEYNGLIIGLEGALAAGVKRLIVEGDSMLVVKQVQGLWKVSAAPLRPLCQRAKDLLAKFEHVVIRHIPRELNEHADSLTNEVVWKKIGLRRRG